MASGSGKDRDDGKQEPARVHGQREDASAASHSGAPRFGAAQGGGRGVSSPPPHPPPPVDQQAVGGGRKAGDSTSAARVGVPGISPPPPPPAPPVDGRAGDRIFEVGGSSSAAAHAAEQAGLPKAKKKFVSKIISSTKNKIFCRKGIESLERKGIGSSEPPHVNQQAIPYGQAFYHYRRQIFALFRDRVLAVNAISLGNRYSEFRPVEGDGECFYRSFIFSYLEQVLDRKDKNEERRLLVAIQQLAEEAAPLGWASEFSRSHEAFKELMKKVKRWKKKRRLVPVLTDRHFKRKLLEFFSTYDQTEDRRTMIRIYLDLEKMTVWQIGAYSTLLHAAWWRAVFRCGPWRTRLRCPSCLCNSMRKTVIMCSLVLELTLCVCTCCSRATTTTSSTQYKSPIARLMLSLGDCEPMNAGGRC